MKELLEYIKNMQDAFAEKASGNNISSMNNFYDGVISGLDLVKHYIERVKDA